MRKISSVLIAFTLFVVGLFSTTNFANAYYNPGTPTGFVNDYTGTLTSDQKNFLENSLRLFEASTTNEIAVVIIPSMKGDYIENFAVKLFAEWGIGKNKKDNGVLLLIAKDDREVRIEVGYGLEPYITDGIANQIIQSKIVPAFKAGNYYDGISAAVEDIKNASSGAYEYYPVINSGNNVVGSIKNTLGSSFGEFIFIIFFIIVSSLFRFLAKSKAWWHGGIIGAIVGVILWIIIGSAIFGLVSVVILVLIGLIVDYFLSKHGPFKNGPGGGMWFGGSGHGGSRGGFGGGFGGGLSGGGGASGRW